MCRDIQLAVAASCLAKENAKLGDDGIQPERSGACIGAGLFRNEPEEMADSFRAAITDKGVFDTKLFGAEGMGQLFPLWLLKYLPNMPACHITVTHNLRGPSNSITEDSAGSAAAIEEGFRIIERGTADLMFVGGAESRQGEGFLRYYSEGILKNGEPGGEAYPVFSKDSSGVVIGEGGAILILEEREKAVKRDADIYAEVLGYYASADASDDADERTVNQARTIREALKSSGVSPEDVTAVHLSANGVGQDEKIESQALKKVFGDVKQRPKLVAAKSLTGYFAPPCPARDLCE